jgi:hypothetical protein
MAGKELKVIIHGCVRVCVYARVCVWGAGCFPHGWHQHEVHLTPRLTLQVRLGNGLGGQSLQ